MNPRWRTAAIAGLLLLVCAVYARGLRGEFEFDDVSTVEFNRGIRHPAKYLALSSLVDTLRGKRVLTDFTFALNHAMGGKDPLPYHTTNLAIHLVAVWLVFSFTRQMLTLGGFPSRDGLTLAVTAMFALHPLQTQAVTYVSQRAESLASVLYLGSLLLLLGSEKRRFSFVSAGGYVLSFLLFVLGLSAKVIVVTLPLAYLIVAWIPGPKERGELARPTRRMALAAPFFLYALLTGILTVTSLQGEDAGLNIPSLPPWRYFITQWRVVVTYLRLLVWPAGQNLDWDFPLAGATGDPAVLACGLFLVAILLGATLLLLRCRARTDALGSAGRLGAFGVFWFFLLLTPTSSLMPLADVVMEHRLYLASLGVFVAAGVLTATAMERLRRVWPRGQYLGMAVLGGVCLALAGVTYARVGTWKTKLALWGDAVTKSPHKARVHLGLAGAYLLAGQAQQAIGEYQTALGLAGADPLWIRTDIRGKLAAALLAQGRSDEAIAVLQEGLREKPGESALLGVLAMAYLRRQEWPLATTAAEQSVESARFPAISLRILGIVLGAVGKNEDAVIALEESVFLDPDDEQGRVLLASAYRWQGRDSEACTIIRRVRQPSTSLEPQVRAAIAACETN